jgi:cellulose synthase/poly-beta-1,6-N-acetylglucosamine synthase-like glycosyltransferase
MKFNTNVNTPALAAQQPQRKPMVVMCIAGGQFTPGFFDSWTKLMLACSDKNFPFDIAVSRHYSPVIYHCRANILGADNRAGKHQIPWQGKVNYDYMMWIDTDIVFEVDQIVSLFKSMEKKKELEVLCGIYLTTSGTHTTIVKDWDLDFFLQTGMFPFLSIQDLKNIAAKNRNKLADVYYAGMGCMMVRKGAFEKVTYPWFEPIMHEIDISKDFSSEDVSLCIKWNEAGVKVWVDPNIVVGHEKSHVIR